MEQRTEPQKTWRKETTLICLDFAKLREKEQNHKYNCHKLQRCLIYTNCIYDSERGRKGGNRMCKSTHFSVPRIREPHGYSELLHLCWLTIVMFHGLWFQVTDPSRTSSWNVSKEYFSFLHSKKKKWLLSGTILKVGLIAKTVGLVLYLASSLLFSVSSSRKVDWTVRSRTKHFSCF